MAGCQCSQPWPVAGWMAATTSADDGYRCNSGSRTAQHRLKTCEPSSSVDDGTSRPLRSKENGTAYARYAEISATLIDTLGCSQQNPRRHTGCNCGTGRPGCSLGFQSACKTPACSGSACNKTAANSGRHNNSCSRRRQDTSAIAQSSGVIQVLSGQCATP